MLVFQATLSFADHVTGRFISLETLWPFGPRNRTQFSALTGSHTVNESAK